jgi:hypothetical protein
MRGGERGSNGRDKGRERPAWDGSLVEELRRKQRLDVGDLNHGSPAGRRSGSCWLGTVAAALTGTSSRAALAERGASWRPRDDSTWLLYFSCPSALSQLPQLHQPTTQFLSPSPLPSAVDCSVTSNPTTTVASSPPSLSLVLPVRLAPHGLPRLWSSASPASGTSSSEQAVLNTTGRGIPLPLCKKNNSPWLDRPARREGLFFHYRFVAGGPSSRHTMSWKKSEKLMDTIKHYSGFPATGVSLRQMVQFGERPSTGMCSRQLRPRP